MRSTVPCITFLTLATLLLGPLAIRTSHAQPEPAEKPAYQNDAAWVFLIPDSSGDKEVQERLSRRVMQTLTEKAFTDAVSKVASAVVSKLGGFLITFINEMPTVGNPTRVKACLLIDNEVAEVARVQQDVLPVILFNYSDTFNAGVDFEIQRRGRFGRRESISTHGLLSVREVDTLNQIGRVDSLFMVIPKRPVRFESAGNYYIVITARSTDGRTTRSITVRDTQSNSAVTLLGRAESLTRSIRVHGHTGHRSQLWLGCTLSPGDPHRQWDIDAVSVQGRFSEEFSIPEDRAERGDRYVVCLWERKIERAHCTLGTNGRPCAACVQMGYHLEGRLARKAEVWNPRQ